MRIKFASLNLIKPQPSSEKATRSGDRFAKPGAFERLPSCLQRGFCDLLHMGGV